MTDNDKSWEAQAVDEIIALENRREEIYRKISYYEHLQFENGFYDTYSQWLDDEIDELQSELEDIQNALGKQ